MALYNETVTFLKYIKDVQKIVDDNINTFMVQTETSRTILLRTMIIQKDFDFDPWISAKASDMAKDAIVAKLNNELVSEATKYFEIKVKELLNTYRIGGVEANSNSMSPDDFLVRESLLPPINDILNQPVKDDWLNYGAYNHNH